LFVPAKVERGDVLMVWRESHRSSSWSRARTAANWRCPARVQASPTVVPARDQKGTRCGHS